MTNQIRTSLTTLFSNAPLMAFELAARSGAPSLGPNATIKSKHKVLTDPFARHRSHQADLVLVAYDQVGSERVPVLALAIEILLERNAKQLSTWDLVPRAFLARYGCLGQVVVICPFPDVSDWANEQISSGDYARQA
jgi:hypothetical protein